MHSVASATPAAMPNCASMFFTWLACEKVVSSRCSVWKVCMAVVDSTMITKAPCSSSAGTIRCIGCAVSLVEAINTLKPNKAANPIR